jgi:small subunit ribosomal protein S5
MTRDEQKGQVEEVTISLPEPEMEEKVVGVDRISRTTGGGRRIRFRALVIVGNRHDKVGVGMAKANDVQTAIAKAVAQAKKVMISVPLTNETIPHQVTQTYGTSSVLLKPAPKGHSIIAGGAVRPVLELAGIKNIVSKTIGSSNALNSAMATYSALKTLRSRSSLKGQK